MNSHRVIGSTRSLGGGAGAVRMESQFPVPPAELWSALTEPERLARWLAEVSGDLRPGGTLTASFRSDWQGQGRVDVCDQPRRIVVTFSPGSDGETVMEAVLAPEGTGTLLVIEERGIPIGEIGGHGAGWQAHIEDLITHLDGHEPGSWRERWIELIPEYVDTAPTH